MTNIPSEELLSSYLKLWNNRQLRKKEQKPEEIVSELIRRELLDENAHPRTRKSSYEKFYLSITRLAESEALTADEKQVLLSLYIEEMKTLQK
ncbi:hypothetical protein [Bacillus sp. MUM 13]|uniref:hypothetical protein n=1 Tax=Bacillus sp. MUM 13 TaxID=1678001 RepID=UPI0008F59724|nr:hypothetical protein [Bacillus sp. MUM 13]OIK09512.1 hypothetical protein BIV59_16855 [Bacillus sp. MUM 13]